MTYSEIRTNFLALLNRTDCDNATADAFLAQGMARAQRALKLPVQEQLAQVTIGASFTGIEIPNDALRIMNVYVDDGVNNAVLERVSLSDYLRKAPATGAPKFWTRNRSVILLNPTPVENSVVKVLYYAEFNAFTDDNDDTPLSIIAPDLFIYGGLTYAADNFLDERLQRYESRFVQIIQELQNQADEDELSGGAVITSPYIFPSDEC